MARLTHKFYTYGNACKKPLVTDKDVWNRLAAYEDTGLTPEEASVLKNSNQHNLDCYVAEHDDSKALRAENARLENERNYWNGSARTLEGAVGTLNRQIDEARDENARLRAELEAAERREQFLTEAYDRQATVHEALTRDYLAAKRDIKRMLQDTDPDGFCVYCQHLYREACDGCEDAEWRGPQEGADT